MNAVARPRGQHADVADAVEANIAGQAEAARTLDKIRGGTSHPDELYTAVLRVWAEGGNPRLLALCRGLQKSIERAVS